MKSQNPCLPLSAIALVAALATVSSFTFAPLAQANVSADQVAAWQHTQAESLRRTRAALDAKPARTARGLPTVHACHQAYARFFDGPSTDIRIAWGYMEAGIGRPPVVWDGIHRQALINVLTEPCSPQRPRIGACGFKRVRPDLYLKTIRDLSGHPHLVRLTITQSSVSAWGPENARRALAQRRQADRSRRNLIEGLQRADAVFYLGHSRLGKGADFGPRGHGAIDPAMTADPTQLKWALSRHPGGGPALTGLIACQTEAHYGELFTDSRAAHALAVITTDGSPTFEEETQTVFGALNSLLGMWCATDFARSIHHPASDRHAISQLRRFFRGN